MNRFIMAYHNFVKNDLATCKKAGNVVGTFFLIVSLLQSLLAIGKVGFVFWFIILLSSAGMAFVFGYLLGIIPSVALYYFVEVVSPRREKSYLPNEKREE